MTSGKKIQSIETIRGITSLSICIFHLASDHLFTPDFFLGQIVYKNPFNVLTFRVISGYVIIHSLYRHRYTIENYFNFLKRRYIRLEPAFISSVLLVIALNYLSTLSQSYRGNPFILDLPTIFSNLFHINYLFNLPFLNSSYWTLFVEWQFYLLIGIIAPFFIQWPTIHQVILLVVLSSLGLFTPNIYIVFRDFSLFSLGILAWIYLEKSISKHTLFITFILLLSISIYVHQQDPIHLIGVCFSFFVIAFRWNLPTVPFLSQISYALFLTHIPVGTRLTHLTSRYYTSDTSRVLILVISVFGCMGFAYLYHLTVEKYFQKKIRFDTKPYH